MWWSSMEVWYTYIKKGGRIFDNLQIDNLQIDNRQIDNLTDFRQIDNRQIDSLSFSKILKFLYLGLMV